MKTATQFWGTNQPIKIWDICLKAKKWHAPREGKNESLLPKECENPDCCKYLSSELRFGGYCKECNNKFSE